MPGAVLVNEGAGRKFTLVRFGDKQADLSSNANPPNQEASQQGRLGPQGAVYGLAIGDVNGDGSLDIVAARSGAPSMLYLNSLTLKTKSRSSK